MSTNNDKSCFDCKYFDGWLCMYDFACKSILNEDDSARECKNYTIGDYNEETLADNDWK